MHSLSGTGIATMSSASSNASMPRLSAVSKACKYHKTSSHHCHYADLYKPPNILLTDTQFHCQTGSTLTSRHSQYTNGTGMLSAYSTETIRAKKLQQFTKLCKGNMSQNSKTAKMVLGRYYRVLNSRLAHAGTVITTISLNNMQQTYIC